MCGMNGINGVCQLNFHLSQHGGYHEVGQPGGACDKDRGDCLHSTAHNPNREPYPPLRPPVSPLLFLFGACVAVKRSLRTTGRLFPENQQGSELSRFFFLFPPVSWGRAPKR